MGPMDRILLASTALALLAAPWTVYAHEPGCPSSRRLCGGLETPCKIAQRWEVLAKGSEIHPEAPPSLALDQDQRLHLLYESETRRVAVHTIEPWQDDAPRSSFEATPFSLSLVLDPASSRPRVFNEQDAFTARIWEQNDTGEWTVVSDNTLEVVSRGKPVVNRQGHIYSGYKRGQDRGYMVYRNGQWEKFPVSGVEDFVTAGISSDRDTAHFTGWSGLTPVKGQRINQLVWWTEADSEVEVIDTFDKGFASVRRRIAMSVGAPSLQNPLGQPHILHHSLIGPSRSKPGLAYVRRVGPGEWERFEVAQAKVYASCEDLVTVLENGGRCRSDSESFRVLGSVTRNQETRFFWSRFRDTADSGVRCYKPSDPRSCHFVQLNQKRVAGSVFMSWVQDGQLKTTLIEDKIFATSGDVVADDQGHLHLAVYASASSRPPRALSYFRLEPGPAHEASDAAAPAQPAPALPYGWLPVLGLGLWGAWTRRAGW